MLLGSHLTALKALFSILQPSKMNWVGGSRNRLVMRNDAKKQREFFEKRKMQQKLRNLGVALPLSSAGDTSSGSTDLMTLFIVNQIATKKANIDPPKVAVLSSGKGRSKHQQTKPLVLPMSPCSPSQLCLVESQSHSRDIAVQGISNRKNAISQRFKAQQLSPVLESGFSDNSASDYLPPITDPSSPTPSTSSASSGQGMFPLQMNLQRQSQTQLQPLFSPPPWDTSVQQQTKFQPLSQARSMTDAVPWTCRPSPPLFQMKTPTAAQGLFGSPKSDETEARDHEGHAGSFFLKPEDREPMGDFMFNQSETNHLFKEDISKGFGNEEYESEASYSGYTKSKIYLTDKTLVRSSAPPAVPDPQSMGVELSNCTDMNSSCLREYTGHVNDKENSTSCSCRVGYLSSESSDEEINCESSLQAYDSYMDQACCADNLNKTSGSRGQQIRSNMSLSLSPFPLAQNSELCKCMKTFPETQDAGTQTLYSFQPDTCDTSTQCSFVTNSETKASGFSLYQPNVDVLEQEHATERQTCAESKTLTASLDISKSEGMQISWSKNNSNAGSQSVSSSFHTFTANNSAKGILQRPTNPFQEVLIMRGKENTEGGGEWKQYENSPLIKDVSGEEKEDTSAGKVNVLSEEAETLQEIADILLLLKQRKKEE